MKTYLTTLFLILSFSFAFGNENISVTNATTSLLSHEAIFNTDSHTSTTKYFAKLIAFTRIIETVDIDNVSHGFCNGRGAKKGSHFTLKGGVDARGKETGKKKLSQVRTKFIHDYSVKQGVNASRIMPKGLKKLKEIRRQ